MYGLIYAAFLGTLLTSAPTRAETPAALILPAAEHICIVDGATVRSVEDVIFDFARQLGFTPYFGRNLAALYNSLRDTPGPLRIELKNSDSLRQTLGADTYRKLLRVLLQVQRERKEVRVIFP